MHRAEQNRAAQREFRQRKERYVKELERKLEDLSRRIEHILTLEQENVRLRELLHLLHQQNAIPSALVVHFDRELRAAAMVRPASFPYPVHAMSQSNFTITDAKGHPYRNPSHVPRPFTDISNSIEDTLPASLADNYGFSSDELSARSTSDLSLFGIVPSDVVRSRQASICSEASEPFFGGSWMEDPTSLLLP